MYEEHSIWTLVNLYVIQVQNTALCESRSNSKKFILKGNFFSWITKLQIA